MRLISNFQDLLLKDQLPNRFCEWWIIEEDDRIQFPDHPFDIYGEGLWSETAIRVFLERTQREIGFFRKKNTQEEIRLQKCFRKQFPVSLVMRLCNLHSSLNERRDAQSYIEHWKERFDPALTPKEQVVELDREDEEED